MAGNTPSGTATWLLALIREGDPLSCLPTVALRHLMEHLRERVRPVRPFLGAETDERDLISSQPLCSWCGSCATAQPKRATTAVILSTTGPIEKRHIPRRCVRENCPGKRSSQWHNFRVEGGAHIVVGPVRALSCFMITTKFGVTVEFLRQLHYRMLREHVSFAGEADVARATASWSSTGDSLPKDLRKCLSKAWFFCRLSLRLE